MRAVTFQAPGEVRIEDVPSPSCSSPDDAVVRVEATGICGSDLHIYHGRVKIEPGFVIGHEFVGTVIAAGDAVTRVARRRPRARLLPHRLRRPASSACAATTRSASTARVFGHGATLGSLQGAQAEQVLVPHANLALRRVPEGISDARRCSPAT